jgi:hypothetical protein
MVKLNSESVLTLPVLFFNVVESDCVNLLQEEYQIEVDRIPVEAGAMEPAL